MRTGQNVLAAVILLLIVAMFGSMGWHVVSVIAEGTSSTAWVARPGVVVSNDYRKPLRDRFDDVKLQYEYTFGGRRFWGSRMAVDVDDGSSIYTRIARELRVGSEVAVYVNPKKPSKSVLYTGFRWSNIIPQFVIVLLVCLLFVGVLAMVLWSIVVHNRGRSGGHTAKRKPAGNRVVRKRGGATAHARRSPAAGTRVSSTVTGEICERCERVSRCDARKSVPVGKSVDGTPIQIALACVAIGTFVVPSTVESLIEGTRSWKWHAYTCVILSNDKDRPPEKQLGFQDLKYEYTVNYRRYTGRRWSVDEKGILRRNDRDLSGYAVGSEQYVYVDPDDPSRSVLRRGYDRNKMYGKIAITLFLVLVGVYSVYRQIQQFRAPAPGSGAKRGPVES